MQTLDNKRIIVTGGAGFVGSNLIKYLVNNFKGIKILSIDNYSIGSKNNHIENECVKYMNYNTWHINRSSEISDFNPDIFFHFGEYSRISTSFKDAGKVFKSNLNGTFEVLEFCRKHNAKLIYSASSSKFGNDGRDENLSPYAWSKSKMVELIKNYHDWFGLNYEICYFFNVYGEGQISEGDYATVIGIFERQFKNGEALTVVSPGDQTRDFTHIDDIILGVIKSTYKDMNREWTLRSGISYKIIDVAKMFSENIKMLPERKGERFGVEEFEDDTREVLNWIPSVNLEEWIKFEYKHEF
jgi:UDP-glucose 4-epimerase